MQAYQLFLLYLTPLVLTLVGYVAWLVSSKKLTSARAIVYGIGVSSAAYSSIGVATIWVAAHILTRNSPYGHPPEWTRFLAATGILASFAGVFLTTQGRGLSRLCLIPATALSLLLWLAVGSD